jgi:HPt (histidine-containing phosphotransfer) domain-containing protein
MTSPHATPAEHRFVAHVSVELQDLIPDFLESQQRNLQEIREAADTCAFHTILAVGHRMKGDAGSYGFDGLHEMGLAIEQAARERNTDRIRRLVAQATMYLDRVTIVYEE